MEGVVSGGSGFVPCRLVPGKKFFNLGLPVEGGGVRQSSSPLEVGGEGKPPLISARV